MQANLSAKVILTFGIFRDMNEQDDTIDVARGERIRYVRKVLLGLDSQRDFADWVGGVTRGAVGNWERGLAIKAKHQSTIAYKAGIDLNWLSNGVGERPTAASSPQPKGEAGADQLALLHEIFDGLPAEKKKAFLADVLGLGDSGRSQSPERPDPASIAKQRR